MSINRKGVKGDGMGLECIDWDIVRVYDSDIEGPIWQMVVWCIGFDLPSFKYYCKRHRLFNLVNKSIPDWYV